MTFSDDAQRKFGLNEYRTRNDAVTAVRSIPYRMGRTNTADAIRFARTNMFSPGNMTTKGVGPLRCKSGRHFIIIQ